MKKIIVIAISLFAISCKKESGSTNASTSTDGPEVRNVTAAKSYYTSTGAQLQFRVAYEMGLAADGKNNNHTSAEVYSIIDNGGKLSVLVYTALPAAFLQNANALINCQGEYLNTSVSGTLIFNTGYIQKAEADVLPNNDLIMYLYDDLWRGSTVAPYGNIGNQGGYYHNVTKALPQNAVTPNGSWGYMYILNNQPYYFSVWGTAYPALHTYNTTTKAWTNQKITAMDGSYKNLLISNDVAKVGNADRVYWAYLSFTNDFNVDGKLNILSFDGTNFSAPKSLVIGDIGEGSGGNHVYKHSVALIKNGSNTQQPYIVVRRYNTDVLDFYKFNGSSLEVVKQGVNLPAGLTTNGNLKQYKNIVAYNGNIYLLATEISTGQPKIYKLNGTTLEPAFTNLLKANEKFTAIEASARGLLVSILKVIPTQPKEMEVSDIVLIP